MEGEGAKWKSIVLVGMSLGGDEARLAAALKSLKKTKVAWISSLPMSETQQKKIAPLLSVIRSDGGLFNGALVRAVGKAEVYKEVEKFRRGQVPAPRRPHRCRRAGVAGFGSEVSSHGH